MLAAACALPAAGCVPGATSRELDRSYDAATQRLREHERSASREPERDPEAPLDRSEVVALAVARSPSLRALAHRARAAVYAGRAEGALPPAELGLAAWNLPLTRPYAVGEADVYMLELRQRFPAAGSLGARARAMAEEASALLEEVRSEERLVATRALDAYADYEEAVFARAVQERQLALLQQIGEAVRARYATGGAALADAARIELESAKARRTLTRLAGDIARARAALNALLRRPPSSPVRDPREGPAETVRIDTEELLARAAEQRAPMLAADAKARAADARREAADAEASVPEFMVGLGYWQTPHMRPGVGVTASMSLPWLWGPARDRVREAEEEVLAHAAARDATGVEAQAEVTEAHARIVALEEELASVERDALPAARRSIDALTTAYATGHASLLDWLDAARSVLDLDVERTAIRASLARSVAALERAVGAPLPRTAVAMEEGETR